MGAVCILCLYSTKFRTLTKGVLSKGRRKGLERENLGLQINNILGFRGRVWVYKSTANFLGPGMQAR